MGFGVWGLGLRVEGQELRIQLGASCGAKKRFSKGLVGVEKALARVDSGLGCFAWFGVYGLGCGEQGLIMAQSWFSHG